MLCEIETEGEFVTGVGPGAPPLACYDSRCCSRTVTLQIRSRFSNGAARLCAAFADPAGDGELFFTERDTVTTYTAYNDEPHPDEVVRTCVKTLVEKSAADAVALVTWGQGDAVLCEAADPVETFDPENCSDTLLDPPADYAESTAVVTYLGGESTEASVKAAALTAEEFGDWSEWADVVVVDVGKGSAEGGYLGLTLAENFRGVEGPPLVAYAGRTESELRVKGEFPLHIAVSEGQGFLGSLTVSRYTLQPGIAQAFSVGPASFGEDYEVEQNVLRCVCPVDYAATV